MIRSFVTSAPTSSRDDAAAAEDEHPVADRGELLVVGAGAEDVHAALLRRGRISCEDLLPRADVDALGRLVQEQQPRLGLHPLRQQRLLLVAAGERAVRRARVAAGARRTRASARPRLAAHPPPVEADAVEVAVEHRAASRCRRPGSEPTLPSRLAVGRDQRDARPRSRACGVIDVRSSRGVRGSSARRPSRAARAEEQVRHLLEAGADQAGEPEDLALVHVERDVADAARRSGPRQRRRRAARSGRRARPRRARPAGGR